MTQPFVGYATTRPIDDGIYRVLMAIGRAEAAQKNLTLKLSAGVASFKRNRGAIATIEYSAVYVAHLPLKHRIATAIVAAATRHIGVPLVKRIDT